MTEKNYPTRLGVIHYWINDFRPERTTLVFLPGLTADHRLFDRQTEFFESRYNVLVWDAPGHAASRPFALRFSLDDKARWLHEILTAEGIKRPILVGQSMGGYVAQCYLELYPGTLAGFVAIDSAPLQRKYVTAVEIWLLRRMEPVYRAYPWKALLKSGTNGVSDTQYGKQLMHDMMSCYNKKEFSALAGHGFRILADAMAKNRAYRIDCPALLLCGEDDRAGSAKRYNRRWAEETGLPIVWLKNAGHNSNTDVPDEVNALLAQFVTERVEKDYGDATEKLNVPVSQ